MWLSEPAWSTSPRGPTTRPHALQFVERTQLCRREQLQTSLVISGEDLPCSSHQHASCSDRRISGQLRRSLQECGSRHRARHGRAHALPHVRAPGRRLHPVRQRRAHDARRGARDRVRGRSRPPDTPCDVRTSLTPTVRKTADLTKGWRNSTRPRNVTSPVSSAGAAESTPIERCSAARHNRGTSPSGSIDAASKSRRVSGDSCCSWRR